MAEIVAGLVVAEQVISATVEGSVVAGYALSRPTLPLKATFSCINAGTSEDEEAFPDSLARSNHSLVTIDGDLYVYGGLVSSEKLAGDEMHILKLSNANRSTLGPQYRVLPAISRDGGDVPCARAGHSACVIDSKVVVFGGFADAAQPKPLDEAGRVWLFDPATSLWTHLDASNERYPSRYLHAAVAHGKKMLVHGGYAGSQESSPESDTWAFDLESRTWTELPPMNGNVEDQANILTAAPPNIAVVDDKLYIVAGSSDLGSQIHVLDLSEKSTNLWTTYQFPTNPLTASPRPRQGAGLVPVSTGSGRSYLLFMLGEKEIPCATEVVQGQQDEPAEAKYWSDVWALQLPSTGATLAQAKDVVRDKTGMDSHELQWAEIELAVEEKDVARAGGKSHPGPRAYFAAAALTPTQIVMWGGINPRGEREGDGWVLGVKS